MSDTPKVSVLMPVYNAGEYLKPAIESILNQTFSDFEFLIIDDGSTDGSLKIIKKFAGRDKRIRLVSRANKGLIATLNEGLDLARGEYLARQDADDISLPTRLEKQVRYLDENPDVGLVGCNFQVIDSKNHLLDATDVFTHPDDLKLVEVFFNHFGHGTVLIRADLTRKNRYDTDYKHSEDYDLWSRLSHSSRLANLSEILYLWRLHESGVTVSHSQAMQQQVEKIREREFSYFIKHQSDFKLLPYHPLSTRRGIAAYLSKKAGMYRDAALLFCRRGSRSSALRFLILAWLCAPWQLKTYKQFLLTVFKQAAAAKMSYEPL